MRFLEIQKNYPHFSQMAQVLFLLAKTYENNLDTDDENEKNENTAEAIKYYQQLICWFPDSPYAVEAGYQLHPTEYSWFHEKKKQPNYPI